MKRSASESYMDNLVESETLPDDLLTLILLRLPFTSVAKFKSVSKHWLSLITTTPQFSPPRPLKALFSGPYNCAVIPLDGTSPPVKTTLVGIYQHYCNGLYLSHKMNSSSDYDYKYVYEFFVSNPTTKLCSPLPQQYPYTDFYLRAAYLAFDPYLSPHYKVVAFSHDKAMIYSSETRHWRPSSAPGPFQKLREYDAGVFWNEAIYWTAVDLKYEEYSLKDKPQVYRFTLSEEETMKRVALPSSDHVLYLGLSGEHLYLIMGAYDDDDFDNDVTGLNMYKMDKGSDRWCHVYCLRDLVADVRARFDFLKVVPTLWTLVWLESFKGVPCCRVVFFDKEHTCLYLVVVGKILVRYDLKARTIAEIYEDKYFSRFTLFSQHMEIIYTAGLTPISRRR